MIGDVFLRLSLRSNLGLKLANAFGVSELLMIRGLLAVGAGISFSTRPISSRRTQLSRICDGTHKEHNPGPVITNREEERTHSLSDELLSGLLSRSYTHFNGGDCGSYSSLLACPAKLLCLT